jgi:hypothetical protein
LLILSAPASWEELTMFVVVRTVLCAAILVVAAASYALAQPAPRADVSAQLSMLRLSEHDVKGTGVGVGGRVTAGLFRWTSIDGELTFTPNDDLPLGMEGGGLTYHRRRTDGFLGVKVGRQFERFGVFAKARPGFSRLTDKGVGCGGDVCALILIAPPVYQTEFVFDLGGVVEFYPAGRIVTRVDVGNTFIRHRSSAPPCSDCTSRTNLSAAFGAGVRF